MDIKLSNSGDILRTSTSKLQQCYKKPSLNLELFMKEGTDVLVHHVFLYMDLEDIVKMSMTCRWISNFFCANKPKMIRTKKLIGSFQMIRPWISHALTSFMCKNLCVSNEDLNDFPPTLEELELGLDQKITNEGIKNLPRNLKKLNLLYGIQISNTGLPFLPPQLTHLSMQYNLNITDNGLKFLPSSLIYLNLASNLNVTDVGLKNLPRNLEYLNLHNNLEITNDGLKYLPPTIKSLVLNQNKKYHR